MRTAKFRIGCAKTESRRLTARAATRGEEAPSARCFSTVVAFCSAHTINTHTPAQYLYTSNGNAQED